METQMVDTTLPVMVQEEQMKEIPHTGMTQEKLSAMQMGSLYLIICPQVSIMSSQELYGE